MPYSKFFGKTLFSSYMYCLCFRAKFATVEQDYMLLAVAVIASTSYILNQTLTHRVGLHTSIHNSPVRHVSSCVAKLSSDNKNGCWMGHVHAFHHIFYRNCGFRTFSLGQKYKGKLLIKMTNISSNVCSRSGFHKMFGWGPIIFQ